MKTLKYYSFKKNLTGHYGFDHFLTTLQIIFANTNKLFYNYNNLYNILYNIKF